MGHPSLSECLLDDTVDKKQILHHQKDGWNPKDKGINHL